MAFNLSFAQLHTKEKEGILSDMGRVLVKRYVAPEKTAVMKTRINLYFSESKYDSITHGYQFALRRTKDLKEFSIL
ncbi:hypothetical protein GCM10007383_32080 [Arenibacter certesii]|uniref:Uncharacterized protein n=1 Tax=Arenibacter certesii TaxID=228955 RepID=A0A918J3J0_9FLAO|nr:hypothetical protein GCM10007383_32080 [Arenibacter certesii]